MNNITSIAAISDTLADAPTCQGKKGNFREFFTINGSEITSFADFFKWQIETAAEQMRKLLAELLRELEQLVKSLKNGSPDQQRLADKASDALKSLAKKNGVDLTSASAESLLGLLKSIEQKILQLVKEQIVNQPNRTGNQHDAMFLHGI